MRRRGYQDDMTIIHLPSQWLSPVAKWTGDGTAVKRMQEQLGGMLTPQSFREVLTDVPQKQISC